MYFEYLALETLHFSQSYQAYSVKRMDNLESSVCSYESLVNYNVLHIHDNNEGELYVPMKYDIVNIMEEHVKGRNPLKY